MVCTLVVPRLGKLSLRTAEDAAAQERDEATAALSGPVVNAVMPLSDSVRMPLPVPVIVPWTFQPALAFTEFEVPVGSFEFTLACAVSPIESTLAEALPVAFAKGGALPA
jgi:hypothetical protein